MHLFETELVSDLPSSNPPLPPTKTPFSKSEILNPTFCSEERNQFLSFQFLLSDEIRNVECAIYDAPFLHAE